MPISKFKHNSGIRKFVCCLAMLLVLFNFSFCSNPRTVRADNGTTSTSASQLEIKVGYSGGVYTSVKTFQLSDLEALPQVQQAYSFIDSLPCPVIDSAVGVKLTDILTDCNIDVNNVKSFGFWTTDVPGRAYETLSKTYLLDTKRYYFPHLGDDWDLDDDTGEIHFPNPSAAAAGAVEVPTILAIHDNWLREQNGSLQPDFNTQDDSSRFRLVFGKTNDLSADVPEHTASKSAKWVVQINVTLNGTAVTGVTLNKTSASLAVASTDQLTATVAPTGATNQSVTWASDNLAAATVDNTGKVTAIAAGSTNITATTIDGGFKATCAVIVQAADPTTVTVTGVSLNKNLDTLIVGDTDQLTATVAPTSATDQSVTWVSDNPAAATVDNTGKVTAIAAGTANITVTTADGGKTATCAVTVTSSGQQLATPPELTASTNNTVGQAVTLNYTDNAAWRAQITDVIVNGTSVAGKYSVSTDGTITIEAGVFTVVGDYAIVVKADGYQDDSVTQTMHTPTHSDTPVYTVSPIADAAYTNGVNADGITTMTVNSGVTGLKYFSVNISPVQAHSGEESIAFVHLRDGDQLEINVTRANFDSVNTAAAGFNVQAGDEVKAYIVDKLTNDTNCNPIIFQ